MRSSGGAGREPGATASALLSELLFGAEASFRDPALFSFAHGGKDSYPYPVDRGRYDRTIAVLKRAVRSAKLGRGEQMAALRRLSRFEPDFSPEKS